MTLTPDQREARAEARLSAVDGKPRVIGAIAPVLGPVFRPDAQPAPGGGLEQFPTLTRDTSTTPSTSTPSTSENDGNSNDPFMQALLQQLEYTKPGGSNPATSQASKVTVLPGNGGGNRAGVVLLVVVVAGVAYYLYSNSKKHHHKGGAQKIEADH